MRIRSDEIIRRAMRQGDVGNVNDRRHRVTGQLTGKRSTYSGESALPTSSNQMRRGESRADDRWLARRQSPRSSCGIMGVHTSRGDSPSQNSRSFSDAAASRHQVASLHQGIEGSPLPVWLLGLGRRAVVSRNCACHRPTSRASRSTTQTRHWVENAGQSQGRSMSNRTPMAIGVNRQISGTGR